MISLVYFRNEASFLTDDLTRAGFQVFEALAISEVLHLCETEDIKIVVIDPSVDEDRAQIIKQHHPTLHLKPEATSNDVIAELWQLFPEQATLQ